jgi:hypothetical protein
MRGKDSAGDVPLASLIEVRNSFWHSVEFGGVAEALDGKKIETLLLILFEYEKRRFRSSRP